MNQVRSNYQIIAATLSTLYLGLFAYGAFFIIHQFENVFKSFNAELPLQTTLLVGSYRYWGVLGLISAIILVKVSKRKSSKAMKVLAWLIVLSAMLVPLAIWGLYSPVLDGNAQTAT